MYKINQDQNNLEVISECTFTEAGFKERSHLQEWIAKSPMCLREELLIIQKEFSGFGETKERLDLLALDTLGNLVIIENKLDDTGKDVVWQALKYVSYCSSLTSSDIEDIYDEYLKSNGIKVSAKEKLVEFFNNENYEEILNVGNSQRIILVAGTFRKEVTSTVLWLLNNGIDITCFKATAYKFQNDYIINFKQIIPLEDAEEFMIKIAEKQKKETLTQRVRGSRDEMIQNFWSYFLEISTKNNETKKFTTNITARTEPWIPIGIGKSGITINLVVSGRYVRSEVYLNRGSKNLNKETFDLFLKYKEQIEKEAGLKFVWERMNDKVTSRIKLQNDDVSVYRKDDHVEMVKFLLRTLQKMQPVFEKYVEEIIP